MKRVLWVLPKWTFPVNDGARVATDSLVRNVASDSMVVDVFSFYDADESPVVSQMKERWRVREVFTCPKRMPAKGWRRALFYLGCLLRSPLMPLTFGVFTRPVARRKLQQVLSQQRYDLVILEGLHLAPALWDASRDQYDTAGAKLVVRAHNVESDLWTKASSESTGLRRMLLRWQGRLVNESERRLLKHADAVAAISLEDQAVFKSWGIERVEYVPLGLDFSRPLEPRLIDPQQFLFLGRLDWLPNRRGLEWLLKQVWPHVVRRRPAAKLKIAGVGDASWLSQYLPLTGVECVGRVDDVRSVYQSAAFCIAPLFFGSGTRIKIIEAFAVGRRLISTEMGVQGAEVSGDMYARAESAEEWIETLSTVEWNDGENAKLQAARTRMMQSFDEVQIGQRTADWLKRL